MQATIRPPSFINVNQKRIIMPFAIGQRWLSESENALGLGVITALDQRTVTIYFPQQMKHGYMLWRKHL